MTDLNPPVKVFLNGGAWCLMADSVIAGKAGKLVSLSLIGKAAPDVVVESWYTALSAGAGRDEVAGQIATLSGTAAEEVRGALAQLGGLVLAAERQLQKERSERKTPHQSIIAEKLAETYQQQLAYGLDRSEWLGYEGANLRGDKTPGVWAAQHEKQVQETIRVALGGMIPDGFDMSYLAGVQRLMSGQLARAFSLVLHHLVPVRNGVLNVRTMDLLPHDPKYNHTSALPYDYDPEATCEPVQEWLLKTVGGDEGTVRVLRAVLNAVVRRRVDLQKLLELIGPGGSGKGTFQRLAMALVGFHNCYPTELCHLEGSRFELSALPGKHLLLITDAKEYVGEVSTLKKVVGQDPLRYEQKYNKDLGSFIASCIVIIAANSPIQSADYTSGFERRRITVPFPNVARRPESLMEFSADGEPIGKLAPYLPGVLNWVLAMPDSEVDALLRDPSGESQGLDVARRHNIVDTNPVAAWANENLVHEYGVNLTFGKAVPSGDVKGRYENQEDDGYPNYVAFMEGRRQQPVSLSKFGHYLRDLLVHQLKLDGVGPGRSNAARWLTNVRLRDGGDSDVPLLITREDDQANDGDVQKRGVRL